MTKDERIERAIELLNEAIDCLEESGGYARVGSPIKYNEEKRQWEEEKGCGCIPPKTTIINGGIK